MIKGKEWEKDRKEKINLQGLRAKKAFKRMNHLSFKGVSFWNNWSKK
jgi:hypothetical protein